MSNGLPKQTLMPNYVLDEQVGYLLRLAMQRHSSIFQKLLPMDLTSTQFAAMVRLAELGTCSQNELGRRTAMDVATIKGVVDRLRKKGLLDLSLDPQDKRKAILSVAETYNDLIPALLDAGAEITKSTLAPLTASERKKLLGLLKKLS